MASTQKRSYRAGAKTPQLRGDGRMSENRHAWLKTATGDMVILKYENSDPELDQEADIESGPTIRLFLPRPGMRPLSINVTSLTHEELKAMRDFFTLLFDLAEPVVINRDRVAQDAFDNGDDSYARVYRQVPQFVVREGKRGAHRQGVHDGSEDVPDGPEGTGGDPGELRDAGDGLVAEQSADAEPEDDGSSAD